MNTEKEKRLYAVYGTLKRGHGNYRHFLKNNKSTYLGTTKTKPEFTLYSLGGFPGIKKGGDTAVEIEVFEIDSHLIEEGIDNLEGYTKESNPENNFYNKEVIDTKFGKAFIYIYNYSIDNNRKIENGIWN